MSTPPAAPLRIALVGDHDPHITAHRAIPLALRLAGEALGLEIAFDWLASDRLPAEPALERYDGFWCVPGSPYRDADAVLRLIAHARGRRRPFLGTCAGFQHTILEFARNALGWQAATHGEEHPHSDQAVIAALPCALLEAREEVRLLRGSRLALAYAAAGSRRTTIAATQSPRASPRNLPAAHCGPAPGAPTERSARWSWNSIRSSSPPCSNPSGQPWPASCRHCRRHSSRRAGRSAATAPGAARHLITQ